MLLMLWLPVRILRVVWPSFLPYTVALQSEAQVNELSLELLLLQVKNILQVTELFNIRLMIHDLCILVGHGAACLLLVISELHIFDFLCLFHMY